jgi:Putative zinc-finger
VSACPSPISLEELVAYWAGELEPTATDALEEHLFGCDACTTASARIAAITERLRSLVPPIVSAARLASLRAQGLRIDDNVVAPEGRSHVTFSKQDMIIHHLSGLSLGNAARVGVSVRVEETGDILFEQPDAPFEAATGEVRIACQRHFAAFPPNVVFVVTTTDRAGAARSDRFFVAHTFAL